jgi:hypothetical protein
MDLFALPGGWLRFLEAIHMTPDNQPKPKADSRRHWHAYEPIYARWRYICDTVFSGDYRRMSRAVAVDQRDLRRVALRHSHLTVRLAAHVVAKLGLNAEWLLCGSGSVFKSPATTSEFVLPPRLTPTFSVFDTVEHAPGVEFSTTTFVADMKVPTGDIDDFLTGARAVYAARVHCKPVGVFVGQQVFSCFPHNTVLPLFKEQHATFLVATLGAAVADIVLAGSPPGFDVNTVAREAAIRGVGYGETFVKTMQQTTAAVKSFFAAVSTLDVPVLLSVEFGEIGRHTAPAVRGAEAGAAIGAAAYTDLLVFTAQLQNFFGEPGGVFIVVGDEVRGVRLLLERFEALKLVAPNQTGFTVVIFAAHNRSLAQAVKNCGGTALFLCPPTPAALALFKTACTDVYAGKVPYDQTHV